MTSLSVEGRQQLSDLLSGLRVLILEDEFLIAMDVEQLCRDYGAETVTIVRSLSGVDQEQLAAGHDVAIIDLMLGGESTLPFARLLADKDIAFVFASGYTDHSELKQGFPEVTVVGKPYAGDDLIEAVAAACGRS